MDMEESATSCVSASRRLPGIPSILCVCETAARSPIVLTTTPCMLESLSLTTCTVYYYASVAGIRGATISPFDLSSCINTWSWMAVDDDC